jgi:hypothetical protein
MTNDDKQTTESFSAQEGLQELDEQALEGVTGAGSFTGFVKGLFKGCITCGAPKGTETGHASEPRVYKDQIPPIHEVGSGGMTPEEVRNRLNRNMSVTVERGSNAYNAALQATDNMRRNGPR